MRTAGVRHSQSTGDSVRALHVTVPGRKTGGHSGPVSTWKPTSPDCITVLFTTLAVMPVSSLVAVSACAIRSLSHYACVS